MKHNNTHIMGIPEGVDNEQGIKNLFEEIVTKNFPNLMKEKDTSPGSSDSPKQVGPKEAIPSHIIIKMTRLKDKE